MQQSHLPGYRKWTSDGERNFQSVCLRLHAFLVLSSFGECILCQVRSIQSTRKFCVCTKVRIDSNEQRHLLLCAGYTFCLELMQFSSCTCQFASVDVRWTRLLARLLPDMQRVNWRLFWTKTTFSVAITDKECMGTDEYIPLTISAFYRI